MAEVHIVDIDSVQWDIKDLPLTQRVAALEEAMTVKDLPDVEINMQPGYTVAEKQVYEHYKVGKIHFMIMRFDNLAGTNIGTSITANIAEIDLHPKKVTTFLLNDYRGPAILRCNLYPNGIISVSESVGVTSGANNCYGELIFAEE